VAVVLPAIPMVGGIVSLVLAVVALGAAGLSIQRPVRADPLRGRDDASPSRIPS
jgi:hypothetical protein